MTVIVGAAEGALAHESPYADPDNPTAKMTRMRHTMLADGATQVVLHFAHWTQHETRFGAGVKATQSVSLAATVEVVGAGVQSNTRGAVSARQLLTLGVDDTATLTFDLPAPVAAGGYFYSNTYATAPLAGGQAQIPRGSALSTARAEGWETNGTDKTLTGTVASPASGGQAAYGPVRVDAMVPGPKVRSVALVGDSIASPRDSPFQQVLAAMGQPHVGVAVAGEAAETFRRPAEHAHRLALIDACDVVLCELGANDAIANPNTGEALSSWIPDLLAVWAALNKGGTRPVWQTTTTPQTAGTFTSTAGQTTTAQTAAIRFVNAWLRAGAPLTGGAYAAPGTAGALLAGQAGHPLRGIVEVADAAETGRDSGVWRSTGGAWTADGLHPTDTGKAGIAAGLDLSGLLAGLGGVLSIRVGGALRTVRAIRVGGVARTGVWA